MSNQAVLHKQTRRPISSHFINRSEQSTYLMLNLSSALDSISRVPLPKEMSFFWGELALHVQQIILFSESHNPFMRLVGISNFAARINLYLCTSPTSFCLVYWARFFDLIVCPSMVEYGFWFLVLLAPDFHVGRGKDTYGIHGGRAPVASVLIDHATNADHPVTLDSFKIYFRGISDFYLSKIKRRAQ